ncbi:hypothetical protein AB0D14_28790 [Streptomyces sp. NPDC048484]|uniref:hypothetical protein n=1 Tax=Streptomyces sp. NPDC048484 TaxID=3155146 RepID=UPI003421A94D
MMRGKLRLSASVALLSLALAACGGSGGGDDDSVASAGGEKKGAGTKVSSEEKAKKYNACLAERGVAPAGGKVGEEIPEQTASEAEVEAALKACKNYAPTAADEQNQKPSAGQLEQMRKYVKCLRKNGYDAPDPDPETGGLSVEKDMDMDKLQSAAEKCDAVNPAFQK